MTSGLCLRNRTSVPLWVYTKHAGPLEWRLLQPGHAVDIPVGRVYYTIGASQNNPSESKTVLRPLLLEVPYHALPKGTMGFIACDGPGLVAVDKWSEFEMSGVFAGEVVWDFVQGRQKWTVLKGKRVLRSLFYWKKGPLWNYRFKGCKRWTQAGADGQRKLPSGGSFGKLEGRTSAPL